jgi:hypothetical protein
MITTNANIVPSQEKVPELIQFIKDIRREMSNTFEIAASIKDKVYKIKDYSEPKESKEERLNSSPGLLGELNSIGMDVRTFNATLDEINIALTQLVG